MATRTKRNKRPKVAIHKLRAMSPDEIAALLPTGELSDGGHEPPKSEQNEDGELCLMEAVAYIQGEPHSDHPRCADPTLTAIGIEFNDNAGYDSERNALIAAVPALVGSRTGSKLVRWKRAKKAAQLLLSKAVESFEDEFTESASTELISELSGNALRTRDDAKAALKALRVLNDGTTVCTDAACSAQVSVEALVKAWNTSGISQKAFAAAVDPQGVSLHDVFEDSSERVEFLQAIGNIRG